MVHTSVTKSEQQNRQATMIKFLKSLFIQEIKLSELSTSELLARINNNIDRLTRLGGLTKAWENEKSNGFKCYMALVDLCEELCNSEKHSTTSYRFAMKTIKATHNDFTY